MAEDRWSTWQAEYAGTSGGPTITQVLTLFAAAALILGLLLGQAPQGGQVSTRVDSPACAELARLERHGATGPSVDRAWRACRDAVAGR